MLESVHKKLLKKIKMPLTLRELGTWLLTIPEKDLHFMGIWIQSFGAKYAPIICINPAYGRANETQGMERGCSCKMNTKSGVPKYFASMDYNAGKHANTNSEHIGTCILWQPPSSGHLHSWRRGYADDHKK